MNIFATDPGSRRRPPFEELDPKTMRRVNAALERYEKESWVSFLEDEQQFQSELFAQFASPDGTLTSREYHNMMAKWYAMVSPKGILSSADTKAALEYIKVCERKEKGLYAVGDMSLVDMEMSFRLWRDLLRGMCGFGEN